jgi:hypothetical protein
VLSALAAAGENLEDLVWRTVSLGSIDAAAVTHARLFVPPSLRVCRYAPHGLRLRMDGMERPHTPNGMLAPQNLQHLLILAHKNNSGVRKSA